MYIQLESPMSNPGYNKFTIPEEGIVGDHQLYSYCDWFEVSEFFYIQTHNITNTIRKKAPSTQAGW